MNVPLVSIVTICWNRKEDILESLKGIYRIDYENIEVIVVDNCSTDDTCDEIKHEFPQVKLIKMYKNIGIEAYNIGFKNANGDYIIILDDDSFPDKYSVKRMVEKFQKDEKLGIVAFDVRNYYNYDEVKALEDKNELTNDTTAKAKDYLMAFNGAGAAVRRELLEEVGFYPEEFFLYWNEQDTAFRILDKGYKIEFFYDIVSYHKYSPKNRTSWRAPYYYVRNAFWVIWKNYPRNVAIDLTISMIYSCLYYSMEQKTFIYIKGMFSAVFNINKLKGKRKVVEEHIWKNLRIPFKVSFTFFK